MKNILLTLMSGIMFLSVCQSQIKALVGGTLIDGFGGKALYNSVILIEGEKDAREKVQKPAKAGVDCIKLIDLDEMTRDEVFAIVDEAHKINLKVVAHSHRPNEIRIGLEAGVDNFEHTGRIHCG